jgi:integron integrase
MGQPADKPAQSDFASDKKEKKLVERFRAAMRERHYSRRTEQTYWYWIRYFIFFHGKRHPAEMGADEVSAFLSWLATERDVAAATQNQALSALLFLYKNVLAIDLPWLGGLIRAQRPVRLPTVLTEAEVRRLLAAAEDGTARLILALLYGAGLRQIECLMLRVKDIDFAYRQVIVRDGKGAKDRVTVLPDSVVQPLQAHLGRVRALHRRDVAEGFGEAWLPHALARKYPRAAREWGWQFVFPSGNRSADPDGGLVRRHHLHPDTVSRMVKRAAGRAGIAKPVSCHTLRHSFATHMLARGEEPARPAGAAGGCLLVAHVDDLVALDAAGGLDLDRVAGVLADEGAGDGGADEDAALLDVGFVLADDLPRRRGAGLVLDVDGRAEDDAAVGMDVLRVDDLRVGELGLDVADTRFYEPLVVARGLVLGVLREVAVRARLGDGLRGLGALDVLELLQLGAQELGAAQGHGGLHLISTAGSALAWRRRACRSCRR